MQAFELNKREVAVPKKPKRSKTNLSSMVNDSTTTTGNLGDPSPLERGNWLPENADNFHYVLSKHTCFEGNILQLNHRYLDIRDIRLVEELEDPTKGGPVDDQEIIRQLEKSNDANPNKDCRRWFLLLRELQIAAGDKHTIRQINTKHINTRSRWSVPFKSLHEVGYLIKNQFIRGVKRYANNNPKAIDNDMPRRRTNIEKKNLAAIKAIRKYICYKELFWSYDTMSVPSSSTQTEISADYPDMEEMSEPERWIRAMIRRHGQQMVDYMDCCAINLTNSYVTELNKRETTEGHVNYVTSNNKEMVVGLLGDLVDEILAKSKPASATFYSLQARPKRTSTSQPNIASILEISNNINPTRKPFPSLNIGGNDYFDSHITPISSKSDQKSLHLHTANVDDNVNEMSDGDRPTFAKRSKSHLLLYREEEVLKDRPPIPQTSASFMNTSIYNEAPENSSHSSSSSLFQRSLMDAQHNANTGEETEECMPCEDGLFTQFIDYEPSSNHEAHVCNKNENNMNMNIEPKMSGELSEGIFNLSVENNSVSFNDTQMYLKDQHMQNDQDYFNQQNQQLYSDFSQFNSHSQPITANSISSTMEYIQSDNVDNSNKIVDKTLDQERMSNSMKHTSTSLPKSKSDNLLKKQELQKQLENNVQPHQDSITEELQHILSNSKTGFTFQLPQSSYGWPTESSIENNISHSQQIDMLSNSIAPLQQGLNINTSEVLPIPIMTSRHQSDIYTSGSMQMSLDMIANSLPVQQETNNQPQVSRISTQPQPSNDSSKLTTTLVMVNGVPSHVELLHDNMDVSPNPIILPISRIKEQS
ncbi:hypothetical protein COEREDRAFT_84746 [Coemansia reversa NRRL 1564]|uniref:Uncharacterized protein n=1 Tax=Coemansia reversa (strain ATCC 12441 / NRRL 1564) TaxID=763665 RepID=A0A2G5BIE5_COERN|nr:hypothetical protein COEREDRAFT_84746 [Coemansia reversa NRRL 1564]|eukprot:PIA18790.1 hypothetical protein COEREDRAFT_84746 [Coemansia reversa NRRL 1564]